MVHIYGETFNDYGFQYQLATFLGEPTLVDVTITHFTQLEDPDPLWGQGPGDYYARVSISGLSRDNRDDQVEAAVFDPFWVFTVVVDQALGSIPMTIEIIDADPWPNPDDLMDINPIEDVTALNLILDLNTGKWSGDVEFPINFSEGQGEDLGPLKGGEPGRVFFDIRVAPLTAITLLSFTAEAGADHVTLAWQTASEIDNEGFNLWRSQAEDGQYTKLNASLIPAQGNADTGASYDYTDTAVVKGVTYYYQLEDVDIHSVSTFHGPVSATPSPVRQIYLPVILK